MLPRPQKSFTMIELLLVMAVIALLINIAILSYRSFEQKTKLEIETENIITTLKLAQTKTMASEQASQYGLHFENNKYVLFKGGTFQPEAPDNKIWQLDSQLEIYDISLFGGGSDVVFDRINGQTAQTGSIGLRLTSQLSQTTSICIAQFVINLCQAPPSGQSPAGQTITKSRHVHFQLGWSIQQATLLKFNFITAGQSEAIEMAPYFNQGKSQFDWQGEFTVNGLSQEYYVHTHQLDATNTLLCIHRHGNNTEEVIISIADAGLDKEIVRYFADGTGLTGPYGNVAEEQ